MRFSGTPLSLFVDIDPGPPEEAVLALETLARSDADGLERLIVSTLPYVDEIVIGVDGRSDDETLQVAQAYADSVHVFEAADIGVDQDEWKSDKIHFANARNLGRSKVRAPWVLVADTDEYVQAAPDDLRAVLKTVTSEGCEIQFRGGVMCYDDHQRLARSHLRWISGTHNQLPHSGTDVPVPIMIAEDKSLRSEKEERRRMDQRNLGIEDLVKEAALGNLSAIFHLAKHRSNHSPIEEAAKLAEDYRSRIEPHSVLADERAWLAIAIAYRYYRDGNLMEADRWAVRALLDGPRQTAFCMLGDIAEDQGDLIRARDWYACACAVEETSKISWPAYTDLRFGRLAGIRAALVDPATAPVLLVEEEGVSGASSRGEPSPPPSPQT